jgi:hypothetical protein
MLPPRLGTQVVGSIIGRRAIAAATASSRASARSIAAAATTALSQSCHGALAASLHDAWNLCWAIATRVGGDPGYPGPRRPEVMPAARPPRALALLQTPGWKVASDEAKQALAAAVERIRETDVIVIDRMSNKVVADVEAALEPALLLSRRINAFESRWPLGTYRAKNAEA